MPPHHSSGTRSCTSRGRWWSWVLGAVSRALQTAWQSSALQAARSRWPCLTVRIQGVFVVGGCEREGARVFGWVGVWQTSALQAARLRWPCLTVRTRGVSVPRWMGGWAWMWRGWRCVYVCVNGCGCGCRQA
jgi:hypothetical protein